MMRFSPQRKPAVDRRRVYMSSLSQGFRLGDMIYGVHEILWYSPISSPVCICTELQLPLIQISLMPQNPTFAAP